MAYVEVADAVESPDFPEGVSIQPREFRFTDVDAIPQYWNHGNPVLTHFENSFSILIPPGERFFIDSVRHYEHRVDDPAAKALIDAFVAQEGMHGRAHDTFNATIANHGIDVARQQRYAEKVFSRVRRWLPAKVQLGITVFSEHLTAVGAHTLLDDPEAPEQIHPQMLEFWRWHAAEELEHKSVAFDLFTRVGGGYATRMVSVLAAVVLLAVPMLRITRAMSLEDRRRPTRAERRAAAAFQWVMMRRQTPLMLAYFRPGFHPWDIDDTEMLREWYRESERVEVGA